MVQPTGRPAGRPPKPTEVKRALGNPGHRPLPVAPIPGEGIKAMAVTPKPPRGLQTEGKKLWNTFWINGKNHLSTNDDLPILLLACQAWDKIQYIENQMEPKGSEKLTYAIPNGTYAANPLLGIQKDLFVKFTAWCSMLGFSPTDRARLGLSEVRESSPMDEMARRRAANEASNG
jgi:P27 family predicted phage terminase small subunit